MAETSETAGVQFGRVLERKESGKKIWLVVLPVIVGLVALVVFSMSALSRADGLSREVEAANARAGEQEQAVKQRDELLVKARADEGILKSPGQASAIFYAVGKGAVESGLAVAHPDSKAVKVFLYGLTQPPAGQEYAVVARAGDGSLVPLGPVLPDALGNGFLMSTAVPEGATAVELVLRPSGKEGVDEATPRIAARYPASKDERGILTQAPAVQARRAPRR
jgi:hypothetical protein